MLLSIMGLYEYDNTLFQGLLLPEGLNQDAVINEILLQCAELEVVYPNITIMKLAITTWSIANQYTWEKLYDTMVVEYNPIWNVDANITETVSGSENRDIDRTGSGSNNESINLTDTEAVKGFNSDTWADSHKNTRGGTDNTSLSSSEVINDDVARSETRTQHRTGNIGVTTTQQMLEQERQIAEFNMINYIAQSFKQRFCLLIY